MNITRTFDVLPVLQKARVHEISGPGAVSFAFLMTRHGETMVCGPPYWLSSLHPESVAVFRDPNELLHVPCTIDADALWSAETGMRSGVMASVIVITERSPGLTNFRRLQLAALAGDTLGLVIVNRPALSTAAETRWHCRPLFSEEGKGVRIHASLYKNKRGIIGSWVLNVSGEAHSLYLDAAPAGEPVWPERIAG